MSDPHSTPIGIPEWLAVLGRLTRAAKDPEDLKTLGSFADPLSRHFSPDAFTVDSAYEVAGACLTFPAYGRVRATLSAWVTARRASRVAALPAPPVAAIADERRKPDDLADPAVVETLVANLERAEPSAIRRIAAETLLASTTRASPEVAARFKRRIDAVIWPPQPKAAAAQAIPAANDLGAARDVRDRRKATGAEQIAMLREAVRRNPGNEAAASRLRLMLERNGGTRMTEHVGVS